MAPVALAYNDLMASFQGIMTRVLFNSVQVAAAAQTLIGEARNTAESSKEQNHAAEQTAEAVAEMSAGVDRAAARAEETARIARSASENSAKGRGYRAGRLGGDRADCALGGAVCDPDRSAGRPFATDFGHRQGDSRYCRPDQSAGAQRRHRSCAGRRAGARICSGCRRGAQAGGTHDRCHLRNQRCDRCDPERNQERDRVDSGRIRAGKEWRGTCTAGGRIAESDQSGRTGDAGNGQRYRPHDVTSKAARRPPLRSM